MTPTEQAPVSAQFIEKYKGLPFPKGVTLVGELPADLVIASKDEVLGCWAGQIHAPAIFFKRKLTEAPEANQREDMYALVFCRNSDQELVGIVVTTQMYNLQRETERLRGECDQIASDHHKDFQRYSNFISKNNSYMLRTGRWFVRRDDKLSDPVDQIPLF
jgi:hypothetical protein